MRAFLLLCLCATCLAAAEPAAPDAADRVIYPRAQTDKVSSAADHDGWSRMPLLIGALALAGAGAWWLWRSRGLSLPGMRANRRLQIEETRSLGGRQYLVVASCDRRRLLLAVTPGRIKLLCELESAEKEGES